jgi:predicted TIM-barrel fold metal-dependent hydrolase
MRDGLFITDFHAHLRGSANSFAHFCVEDQASHFLGQPFPVLERILGASEPIHEGLIRWLALNYRDAFSRYIYSSFGQIGLMEALRLFKTYDIESLLRSMNRNGIDHAVVCSLEPLITTQEIVDVVRPYRDRFSIFASVGRNQPDPAGYFEKWLDTGEISGLKIHPIVGGYACNELFDRTKDVVALAVERDLPILIHTGHIPTSSICGLAGGCGEVTAIEPLVRAFPRGRFVLAHIGWESWRYILDLCQQYKQVMVETSWQSPRVIRRAVDALGAERVLFGSDFPLLKQRLAMNMVRQAVTGREFVALVSTNARNVMREHLRAGAEYDSHLAS